MYGAPWELCEGARQHSLTQVEKGFAPSWEGLTCANVTHFGPRSAYSQVVPLTEGWHTLFAGTIALVRRTMSSVANRRLTNNFGRRLPGTLVGSKYAADLQQMFRRVVTFVRSQGGNPRTT